MYNKKFRRGEPQRKTISCSCGNQARIVKRRNFPFGRKSVSRTIISYFCKECNNRYFLNKIQEVRK